MTRLRFLCLIASLLLAGCADTPSTAGISALPVPPDGPGDAQLMAKIKDYIARQKGPAHSQYEYALVDMNGDGRRDGLVYFKLPYGYWCGWGGCTLAIFAANPDAFVLSSEITRVRGPIIVTKRMTNGWRDIALHLSGSNMADSVVLVSYGADGYPANPTSERKLHMTMGEIDGDRLFP
jgi:hypothetical protein